jgi:hypothetical protein
MNTFKNLFITHTLSTPRFSTGILSWIIVQALGNLARYRIVIVAMVPSVPPP